MQKKLPDGGFSFVQLPKSVLMETFLSGCLWEWILIGFPIFLGGRGSLGFPLVPGSPWPSLGAPDLETNKKLPDDLGVLTKDGK